MARQQSTDPGNKSETDKSDNEQIGLLKSILEHLVESKKTVELSRDARDAIVNFNSKFKESNATVADCELGRPNHRSDIQGLDDNLIKYILPKKTGNQQISSTI
jgi:hypothetical protein